MMKAIKIWLAIPFLMAVFANQALASEFDSCDRPVISAQNGGEIQIPLLTGITLQSGEISPQVFLSWVGIFGDAHLSNKAVRITYTDNISHTITDIRESEINCPIIDDPRWFQNTRVMSSCEKDSLIISGMSVPIIAGKMRLLFSNPSVQQRIFSANASEQTVATWVALIEDALRANEEILVSYGEGTIRSVQNTHQKCP